MVGLDTGLRMVLSSWFDLGIMDDGQKKKNTMNI